jgi:3-oxoacyl-[acyl-carrier-protein] synthase II
LKNGKSLDLKYSVAINDMAVVTPFGVGIDPLWDNLVAGRTAVAPCTRLSVENFPCKKCSALDLQLTDTSILWSLFDPICEKIRSWNADFLVLATTKGEIDLLEKQCRDSKIEKDFSLSSLLDKTLNYLNIPRGMLVSAACASSSVGISRGSEMILAARAERVAVIGIDIVSKFVFSGFSALQALSVDNDSNTPAKPFDANRDGLIVGEACGAVLLEKDVAPRGDLAGQIFGWGEAADANHVTGPSRDGSGLASAIFAAMEMSGIKPEQIGAVSAHGTGTVYNDNMEMLAFKSVFPEPIPVFSVKGALGHTMGASGTLETIISLKSLQESLVPPTVGFKAPDENSEGWVSSEDVNLGNEYILKTNSGFGGINTALILAK